MSSHMEMESLVRSDPGVMDSQWVTKYTNGMNMRRLFHIFIFVFVASLRMLLYPPNEIQSLSPFGMDAYWFVVRLSLFLSSIGIVMCCLYPPSSARPMAHSIKLFRLAAFMGLAFLYVCVHIAAASKIIVHKHGSVNECFTIFGTCVSISLGLFAFIYWWYPGGGSPPMIVSEQKILIDVLATSEGVPCCESFS